ncbi:MAG: hypothetical protein JSV91_11595 [Phycisphaerales bacterium]|nr:MAG: hypothetical protein JSV91_11595 [Phycisphaerales bacterium]
MISDEWAYWLYGVGLIVAIAGLVFAAWWALFADRPRGRRRCPRCWYDMAYSPGMTCSECGFTARTEKDFSRTHRRWKIGLTAILGGAILGGFVIDRANLRGWPSYLPSNVLIWSMPLMDIPSGALYRELDDRLAANRLTDEQWLAVLRRCAKGDAGARPVDDDWLGKYAEVLRVYRRAMLARSDEPFQQEVERILLSIPPRLVFSTRDVWPADVAPSLHVGAGDWWPEWVQIRAAAMPRLPEAESDVHVRLRDPLGIPLTTYTLYLPPLEEGEHEVEIEVKFSRRFIGAEGPGDWTEVGNQTVTVPLKVQGTLAETMTPVDNEELSQIIRAVFEGQPLAKYPSGSLPVRVRLDPSPTYRETLNDTAIGIRVDVLRNGVLGRQLDLWWKGGAGNFDRQYDWEVPYLNDEVLLPRVTEDDVWTLRVRGLPELALRLDNVSKYWSGQVEVVVPTTSEPQPAPPRGWIPEDTIPAEAADPPGQVQ